MKKISNKWAGQACPICAAGVLHDDTRSVPQDYKGHSYLAQVHGAFCDNCEEAILAYDAAEESAWIAFRNKVDREAASELVAIRKRLKLTQAQAAKLAGGGKNAFSRYERGQAKPVAAVLNLFKLLDRHPDLIRELA
jgi:HTH-type transcriptional regulator/antitoxin MqsA